LIDTCEARSAILNAMANPGRHGNKRARISLTVFLRLTAMDVCCGPPSSH
jgi:hypothetical protein